MTTIDLTTGPNLPPGWHDILLTALAWRQPGSAFEQFIHTPSNEARLKSPPEPLFDEANRHIRRLIDHLLRRPWEDTPSKRRDIEELRLLRTYAASKMQPAPQIADDSNYPASPRLKFLSALGAWVNKSDLIFNDVDRGRIARVLLRAPGQARRYRQLRPTTLYRGIAAETEVLAQPSLTSWTRFSKVAMRFSKTWLGHGLIIAEPSTNLDIYTVVHKVIRSLTPDEQGIGVVDFFRARGEAEVLVRNYQPSDAMRIVWQGEPIDREVFQKELDGLADLMQRSKIAPDQISNLIAGLKARARL